MNMEQLESVLGCPALSLVDRVVLVRETDERVYRAIFVGVTEDEHGDWCCLVRVWDGTATSLVRTVCPSRIGQDERLAFPWLPLAPMADLKKWATLQALTCSNGSTSEAADRLKVSVRWVQNKMKEWGIKAADFR